MLSEAARLVAGTLRQGKDAPSGPLEQRRSEEAEALALLPVSPGVTVRDIDVVGDSILAEPDGGAEGVVLYLHGGAYVTGTGRSRASIASYLAAATGAAVLSLDYRLAPEHPYPAGLEDALTGLARCADIGGDAVAVAGDSAGGGLTLATLVQCRDRGLPMPRCAVLFSPWADLTMTSRAVTDNADAEAMLRADRLSESAAWYAGDLPVEDPQVSPRFALLDGLPPLQVLVSGHEVLLDDAIGVAESVARSGGQVELQVWPEIFHAWPVATGAVPEADAAVRQAGRFIREQFGRP
jgi:acetyl esterase/lipase